MSDPEINLEAFKEKLLKLRESLITLGEASQASSKPVLLDQSAVGRLSRMDAMQSQAMSLEVKRRRSLQLERIAGALQRIENDAFGDCLKCEESIPSKRLDFDPTTFLCVSCAEEAGQ